MRIPTRWLVLPLALVALALGLVVRGIADETVNADFEAFHAPLVKCSKTTELCGLPSGSSQIGSDPIATVENSRALIKKNRKLKVKVIGAAPSKQYDVDVVFTPGGSVACSGCIPLQDPTTCCTTALDLMPVGSFTTDANGDGLLVVEQIDSVIGQKKDSVQVLITDHTTGAPEDAVRQFISGFAVHASSTPTPGPTPTATP